MPIVWEHQNGTVGVMNLSEQFLASNRLPTETTEEAVTRLSMREQARIPALTGATATLIKTANMPVDRENRNAWRMKNGKCEVDQAILKTPSQKSVEQRLNDLETKLK